MKKFCNWVTYGIDMEQRKRLLWLVVIWVIFALAMLWIISGIGRANASTILVHAGDDLQSKLNGASPGDMLVLDAGAAWTGPLVLPNKGANAVVVTLQSSSLGNLPVSRIGPSDAVNMATILDPSDAGTGSKPAICTADGANGYLLIGIEVRHTNPNTTGQDISMVNLGNNGALGPVNEQTTSAQQPYNITLDRCYVHGPGDATNPKSDIRGAVGLHGKNLSLTNCYLSGICNVGSDCHAVNIINGEGPFKVDNCYLEATTENFICGGDVPHIGGLVPNGLTFSNNLVSKPLQWNACDPTGAWRNGVNYNGSAWDIKNLFELKSGVNFTVTGNTFENCWVKNQAGSAWLLTPRGQTAGENQGNTSTAISNVTFSNNVVRHCYQGIQMLDTDDTGAVTKGLNNISFRNNLFYDIGDYSRYGNPSAPAGGPPQVWSIVGGAQALPGAGSNLILDHNTFITSPNTGGYSRPISCGQVPTTPTWTGFQFTNNIVAQGTYNFWNNSAGGGGYAKWAVAFPSPVLNSNVIFFDGGNQLNSGYLGSPDSNTYPASLAAVGFNNVNGGDYLLGPNSVYKGKATDGSNPGYQPNQIATTTTLTTPASMTTGSASNATATVTAADGSTPTGQVSITVQGISSIQKSPTGKGPMVFRKRVATVKLLASRRALPGGKAAPNAASLDLSNLAAGTYQLQASFVPTGNYAASTSTVQTLTVGASISLTTTTSMVSPSFMLLGSLATAVVTIAAADGSVPTGTVSLTFAPGAVATHNLVVGSNTTTFQLVSTPVGTYPLQASYNPTGQYVGSSSLVQNLTVAKSIYTTTTLAAPASMVPGDKTKSATVTVTAVDGSTPVGSAIFTWGPGTNTNVALDSFGTATFSLAGLAVGSYSLSAVYTPSGNYGLSNSIATQLIVATAPPPTVTITLSGPLPAGVFNLVPK